MVRVPFPGNGRTWDLLVAAEAAPAWYMFIAMMLKHNYLFLETAGGTYVCRTIGGTNVWSLHSYGTAVDLNPSKNPFKKPLTHNYPQGFINDVLALKATDGTPLFRWGGSWSTPDAMHWEVNCPPSAIPQYTPEEYEMRKGDKGLAVAEVQHALDHRWGYDLEPAGKNWPPFKDANGNVMKSQYDGKTFVRGTDGDFGDHLEALVKKFQSAQNLPATGVVDGITHSMIFGRYGSSTGADNVARQAASNAQADATAAHTRLNKLHAV